MADLRPGRDDLQHGRRHEEVGVGRVLAGPQEPAAGVAGRPAPDSLHRPQWIARVGEHRPGDPQFVDAVDVLGRRAQPFAHSQLLPTRSGHHAWQDARARPGHASVGVHAGASRGRIRPQRHRAPGAGPAHRRRGRLRFVRVPAAPAGGDPLGAGGPGAHRRLPAREEHVVRDIRTGSGARPASGHVGQGGRGRRPGRRGRRRGLLAARAGPGRLPVHPVRADLRRRRPHGAGRPPPARPGPARPAGGAARTGRAAR